MLMPASSEFIALCRSQVSLLTHALGASLSIVYLTEDLVDGAEAQLVPIAAYPESLMVRQAGLLALPLQRSTPSDRLLQLPSATLVPTHSSPNHPEEPKDLEDPGNSPPSESTLLPQRQVFLPLIHEGVMLGLLVTGREDRAWNEWERAQIDRVGETLAIACVLDQRYQWLDQEHHQQQATKAHQRELMDNLLHQFRNPLTALKTFGKLLVKRLLPNDPNRDIASGIVRESDRLQELLLQFDQVMDLDRSFSEPPSLPAARGESALPVVEEAVLEPSPPEHSSRVLIPAGGGLSKADLQLAPCSITTVLEPLLISAAAIAQERQIDLQTSIPDRLPLVLANNLALREVLSNILDNALKYTPAGAQVFVQVGTRRSSPQGEQVAIAMSDTGVGIPANDLAHIFERHYRGVQSGGTIPGTGLGLAIARELVQQMQGEIEVFSPSIQVSPSQPPSGTTFVVWLLLAP